MPSVAFQLDPLETLKPAGDSTLALMRAASERGYRVFCYQPERLTFATTPVTRVSARGVWVERDESSASGFKTVEETVVDLSTVDVVWIRQDPPFDMAYISYTHVLEHISGQTLLVNDAKAIRNAPEKMMVTHFPDLIPPTLISRDPVELRAFWREHGDIVLKPLNMFGGRQVVHLTPHSEAIDGIFELYFAQNREPLLAQKYLAAVKQGDKRIIMIDGVAAACFRRVPAEGDFRANMRVGGQPQACMLTPEDDVIVKAIGPSMREQGLLFVGIDVIGTKLIEINVTSPTGLVQADALLKLEGRNKLSHKIWDAIEARRKNRKN